MPMFSVVVPTYNRAAMLRAALASVRAQTLGDWECFVLDDGSKDGTPAVFEEFAGDARFRLHRFEDNRRQHVRRNFAIRAAQGAWVTFLDSDDLWLPRRLEAFRETIERRPEAGFVFSNAYQLRYGRVIGTVFRPGRPIPEGTVPGWYAVGDRYLPYLTSNLAIRREAFDRTGVYREDLKILEDTELYARMLAGGLKVAAIHAPLAVRRLHEHQITHDYAVDFAESVLALKSGGAPPEVLKSAERSLALEIATYFLKGVQPDDLHAFLRRHVDDRGLDYWKLFLLGLVPRPLLAAARRAREAWLKLRFSGLLAPRDHDRVRRWLQSPPAPAAGAVKLSVVIPVYNERATIERVVREVRAKNPGLDLELVIVDDASTDGTWDVVKGLAGPGVKVLKHPANRGKGAAIRTGLAEVTGTHVVIQDADLEYDPAEFPLLLAPLRSGARVVYGSRILSGKNPIAGPSFYLGGRFLSWLTQILYGAPMSDEPTCYKLVETGLLRSLDLECERFEFCPEVTAKVLKRGIPIAEVPITYRPRSISEGKKIRWKDGVEAIWTLLKYRVVG